MDPEEDTDYPETPGRARRAKAIGAVSVLAVTIACLAYLRPPAPTAASAPIAPAAAYLPAGYHVDALDFVDPADGWVLVDLDTSQFAVLSTTDAGAHWTKRLVSNSTRQSEYMRFFNRSDGVVAATGTLPTIFETRDGGAHWSHHAAGGHGAYALSVSFVDEDHGWMLGYTGRSGGVDATAVYSTSDGGATWVSLGPAVEAPAEAFTVTFADRLHGWLDSVAGGPYAFATADGGVSWQALRLPEPAGGWPAPHGVFFVAIRPTLWGGLIASVVNAAQIDGRSASGTSVVAYPPLTVRTFDGGSPVIYVYSMFVDSSSGGILHVIDAIHKPGPAAQIQPANQIGFRSVDGGATWTGFAPPGPGGTIGYSDGVSWWWVGPGSIATTQNAGMTWTVVRPSAVSDPLPGSLVVLDSRHAWVSAVVGGVQVLYSTSDGGAHWNEVRLPPFRA